MVAVVIKIPIIGNLNFYEKANVGTKYKRIYLTDLLDQLFFSCISSLCFLSLNNGLREGKFNTVRVFYCCSGLSGINKHPTVQVTHT